MILFNHARREKYIADVSDLMWYYNSLYQLCVLREQCNFVSWAKYMDSVIVTSLFICEDNMHKHN